MIRAQHQWIRNPVSLWVAIGILGFLTGVLLFDGCKKAKTSLSRPGNSQ